MRPADQATRDRLLSERERNVVIEASAGTGKTTLLIERVRRLVESGMALDRICVVTFTEAAAAELRSRLRSELPPEVSAGLSQAWIHTIHAFARRVLQEYSHLTGVDPDFAVCPERFTPLETSVRWDRYVTGLTSAGLEGAAGLAGAAGTEGIRELVRSVLAESWIESGACFGSTSGLLTEFTTQSVARMERLLDICIDSGDLLHTRMSDAIEWLRSLEAEPWRITEREKLLNPGCGSKANWGGEEVLEEVKDEVRAIVGDYESRIAPTAGFLGAEQGLDTLVMPFVRDLRRSWDSDGSRLSYDDLLIRAASVLHESPHLAAMLEERFDHVLIDEFQDTSRIQTGIFRSFLSKAGSVLPGRLSVVGDRKQSIYGWRQADIETYGEMVDELEEGGALSETITVNFRSTRSIIRFVNAFGESLFAGQTPEELPFGCTYSPLEPAPGAADGSPVEVLALPDPPEDRDLRLSGPAWSARCQAELISGRISVLRGEDISCSWGDFAVLMRATGSLDQFISVFEREGIPYTVDATTDFRKLLDTADLREILRCMASPDSRRAWIHTLRSSFFGLSDTEISEAIRGGTTGFLEEGEDCPLAVACANSVLRLLLDSTRRLPLRDFMPQLLFGTDFLAAIAASGYQVGRRLANVQNILEMTMNGSIRGIPDLIAEMDERLAPAAVREPASLPEEGDAVTVTTIHRAKGLAYRHVFLTGLGTRMKKPDRHTLLSDQHTGRAAFSFGAGSCTAWWPDLKVREEARALAELRRLLYVAVTRARDSLTIFRTPPGNALSPARMLADALEGAVVLDPASYEETAVSHEPGSPVRHSDRGVPTICPQPLRPEGVLFPVDITVPGQSREQQLGTAVHAVLEKMDFDDPAGWLEEHAEVLDREWPELATEARELVLAFFGMDLPVRLESCAVIGREYPYMVDTPSGPKTRYVDLLLDAGDGLVVLDYKTDHVPDGDLAAAAEQYMEVQGHYVHDLAEAFRRPVAGYLVFLREGAFIETARSG